MILYALQICSYLYTPSIASDKTSIVEVTGFTSRKEIIF